MFIDNSFTILLVIIWNIIDDITHSLVYLVNNDNTIFLCPLYF